MDRNDGGILMIRLEDVPEYQGKVTPASAAFPFGSFLDNPTPGLGTPFTAVTENVHQALIQKLFAVSGVAPNGQPDTALQSQLYDVMRTVFNENGLKLADVTAAKQYEDVEKLLGEEVFIISRNARFIVETTGGGPDNDMDRFTSDVDGNYAFNLVRDSELILDANQLGATPDPLFDNSDYIERAAEILKAGYITFRKFGQYGIGRTTYTPVGVYFAAVGNRSFAGDYSDTVCFTSISGGTYVENFLFFQNIDPNGDTEDWVVEFPNVGSGGAKNLAINGQPTNGINGFKFAGSNEYEDIDTFYVGTLCRKPSPLYIDKIAVKRIQGRQRANNTDYLVDLPGSGDDPEIFGIDAGIIQGASFPAVVSSTTKGLRLGPARGASIKGLINGDHVFQQGKYDLSSLHIEHGSIECLNGDVTLRDSDIFNEADKATPVRLTSQSAGGFSQRFKLKMENVQFSAREESSLGGWPTTDKPDLQTNANFDIEIVNCTRRISTTNDQTVSQQYMGIVIEDENGVLIDGFNDYSHVMSRRSHISNNVPVTSEVTTDLIDDTFTGVVAGYAAEATGNEYKGPTGTAFYSSQIILDPVRRVGRNSTTSGSSIALTNGGPLPRVDITWGNVTFRSGLILRLYKGSVDLSYDQYVDIPIVSCTALYDNGNAVNGFPWKPRTAGAKDGLNPGMQGEVCFKNGKAATTQTSVVEPTTGTWKKGDVVYIDVPVKPQSGDVKPHTFRRITNGSAHVIDVDWFPLNNYEP